MKSTIEAGWLSSRRKSSLEY